MKSKLLLMTLALMSTLSSKCAYGMDNPNINRSYIHTKALNMLADDDLRLHIGCNMLKNFCRTHADLLDANFVRSILGANFQNQITAIDPVIVKFFQTTQYISGPLLNLLPAPNTFQPQAFENICNHAILFVTNNHVIRDYLCAYGHQWELLENDGPTKFAIELMNFLTEYPTLGAQENAYETLFNIHSRHGGHANSDEYFSHCLSGDIATALRLLINDTDSSPIINECKRKLTRLTDLEPVPFAYIDYLPKRNMIDHNVALNQYLQTRNTNTNPKDFSLKSPLGILNRYELDISKYLIRLGVIDVPGDGNCGYRAMDTDINRATSTHGTSRTALIEHLLTKIHGTNGDLLKKMVADEIAFIVAFGPYQDESQFFTENNLHEIQQLFVQHHLTTELLDQASVLAMNWVPQYLTFLKNNNIWMRLTLINGSLSGVSAAIAHSLGKNLIVVDANGQIAYKYYAMLPDTMFIAYVCKTPQLGGANSPNHFQKCFVIKQENWHF